MAVFKDYIEKGIDVNAVSGGFFKSTALHRAAQCRAVDVAKVLIQNGADVNAVNENKETPLEIAAANGQVDVAKFLIQSGVDVNASKSKLNALQRAAKFGSFEFAKVLIQNGADVNAVDVFNMTPLHNAAWKGRVVLTLQLLCLGASIDEKALEEDKTRLLGQIKDRMNLLRAGKRPETSLMSNQERRFMWELAFSLTIQHRAAAFKAYYTIRSFITFHGIFMADGYGLGDESVWKEYGDESFWKE